MSATPRFAFFSAPRPYAATLLWALLGAATPASAAIMVPFSTDESSQYLIVTLDREGGNTDVAASNFELGANKAPVPSTDSFLNGGSSGGPTLLGAVPDLPASGIETVFQGVGGHGNIAVTDPAGELGFSDIGIYADPSIGIRVAAPNDSFNSSSNTFFNDPNQFPNTFTPTGPTGTGGNLGGTGTDVNPNGADQNTRVDPTGQGNPSANVGITFNFDHSDLLAELAQARLDINALSATNVLDTSNGNEGELENNSTIGGPGNPFGTATLTDGPTNSLGGVTQILTIPDGLSIIDIDSGDSDFSVDEANFIIDGPAGSSVIFRLSDDHNMLVGDSNILLGDGGIGRNNVLFYTDQGENDTHFDFSNAIINGAAFWSLGDNGGTIGVSNAQGSTQLIADVVDMDNVRFTRWSFIGIPEPSTGLLIGLAVALGTALRRQA